MYQHRRLNLHLPLDHVILTNSPVVDHQNSDDKKTTPLKIDAQKINTCLMKHKAHLAGGGFRERGGSGGWGGGLDAFSSGIRPPAKPKGLPFVIFCDNHFW